MRIIMENGFVEIFGVNKNDLSKIIINRIELNKMLHFSKIGKLAIRVEKRKKEKKKENQQEIKMGKWGDKFNIVFNEARNEHALLLRCEGLTYQRISEHFGLTSREYARILVYQGAARLNHAMRKTKIYYRR